MLRSFPARTSSHNSRSRRRGASFGQQRSYTRRLQNRMSSSFPFALRPGEPKSTHTMMTFVVTEGKSNLLKQTATAEQREAAFGMEGRRILSTETSFTSRPAPRTS